MTFRGRIENGVVRFDGPVDLPDGTEVNVHPVRGRRSPAVGKKSTARKTRSSSNAKTLLGDLAPVIGKAKGLPRDAARNFKHYLYGHPKR